MEITVTLKPAKGHSVAMYVAETVCGHYCEAYADQFSDETDFAKWALTGFLDIEEAWATLDANRNSN